MRKFYDEYSPYFWGILIGVLIVILTGCASKVAIPEPPPGLFGGVKAALAGISATTSWITFISILGIGAGIAAVFILPGDDKLPWGIVVGSGAMLGVALFIQTSLGFFPWIVGGCLLAGGFWLYKRIKTRKLKSILNKIGITHESTSHSKPG